MKSIVMFLLVAVSALFGVSLLQSEGAAAAPAAQPVPTPPQVWYISSSSSLTLKNNPAIKTDDVKAADEDIVMLDPGAGPGQGTFSLYFDGSDVGLKNVDVDAFELVNDGILISFDKPLKMVINNTPNVLVDDSDIVKFEGTTGTNTVGEFKPCFDGSAFDLSSGGEDIDAITFDALGRLVISTDGTAKVNGNSLVAADEDLLVLGTSAFNCNAGALPWSLYIDGTDLALTAGSEDIGGAWIDNSTADKNIFLTTKGNFNAANGVNAISGDSDDIFGLTPFTIGETTSGFLFATFDGDLEGLKKTIDGIFATPGGTVTSAALNAVDVPVEVVQYEALVDDEATADAEIDENDRATDGLDAEEIVTKVMLPLVVAE